MIRRTFHLVAAALALALLPLPARAQTVADNTEFTALSSAARTTTTSSSELTNRNGRGIAILLDVTAVSSGQITGIDVRVPLPSGAFATIYSFGTLSITTTGQRAYLIYPGAASAGSWTATPIQGPIPRRFVVRVNHQDSNSITYSVTVSVIH